jgi:archaetidylinositol phosphate synthase
MSESNHHAAAGAAVRRPWDARLARRLVTPLKNTWVRPNHLTTVRLIVGLGGAAAFLPGDYLWSIVAALLIVLSNFLDHTDGELARMTGRTSRIGHLYDLASDALITVLLFAAIGVGVGARPGTSFEVSPALIGALVGATVAVIFFLRMRMEGLAGKAATRQASVGGFETEDILYLIPLAALCDGLTPMLIAASICAPLYAVWVIFDYCRMIRQQSSLPDDSTSEVAR